MLQPEQTDNYHMKTFKVCESKNGCHIKVIINILKVIKYIGDEGLQVSPFGKTRDLVMTMPFANQGYSVYMDNFYTSPCNCYWAITAMKWLYKRFGWNEANFER